MRRNSGRINLILLGGTIGLIGIVIFILLSGKSFEATAEAFMQALAKKDVKTLTELSYLEKPEAPLEQQWDECVNKRAKTYNFVYFFDGANRDTNDRAVMRVVLVEFLGVESKETDTFELPLVLIDGKWKVDLASLSRKFFPALPR